MSKYQPLWDFIRENGTDGLKLSYEEIEKILGFPIDHAFLTYKKELLHYGFMVEKISMKDKTVLFKRGV
ncbi:MAG: hypothetical protein MJ059_03410 [Lachnospiraceae bacterium]|nr:hypothetical protein [Lachnospiraceae bacterium]